MLLKMNIAVHVYPPQLKDLWTRKRDVMRSITNRPIWATEWGCTAGTFVGTWGMPESNPGPVLDYYHLDFWRYGYENQDVYERSYGYALHAADNEGIWEDKMDDRIDPNDYGFGLFRVDKTPRPTFEWLRSR
jgi:hypothetical protein